MTTGEFLCLMEVAKVVWVDGTCERMEAKIWVKSSFNKAGKPELMTLAEEEFQNHYKRP